MRLCLAFFCAIAMYRSIQTRVNGPSKLSNKFSTNHEKHATASISPGESRYRNLGTGTKKHPANRVAHDAPPFFNRSRVCWLCIRMACKPANTAILNEAMPTSRPAKKYTKPIGFAAARAPYFLLPPKKRRIKTSPPKKPKTIPRKKRDPDSIAQWK
jgi:hypothetical protein